MLNDQMILGEWIIGEWDETLGLIYVHSEFLKMLLEFVIE